MKYFNQVNLKGLGTLLLMILATTLVIGGVVIVLSTFEIHPDTLGRHIFIKIIGFSAVYIGWLISGKIFKKQ